jgi:hypothetical protein
MTEARHSRGGSTTRDALDQGVPMRPGSPDEPVGPEDAADPGPKRGDYRGRMGDEQQHFATEPIPEAERVPGGPTSRLVPQNPNAGGGA